MTYSCNINSFSWFCSHFLQLLSKLPGRLVSMGYSVAIANVWERLQEKMEKYDNIVDTECVNFEDLNQLTFTCSKSTIEILEKV